MSEGALAVTEEGGLVPETSISLSRKSDGGSIGTASASWAAKLRRVCSMRDYQVIARVALSVGSSDTSDLLEALAHECLRQDFTFFTRVLREFRLREVPPSLSVELYHLLEPWLREQHADATTWVAVLYALALNSLDSHESPDEALSLLSEMERGADPRLPEPPAAGYCVLVEAIAASKGLMVARQLLSRSALSAVSKPDPIFYLMLAVVHSSYDLDMAKKFVRKGEMLTRSWRSGTMLNTYLGLNTGVLEV